MTGKSIKSIHVALAAVATTTAALATAAFVLGAPDQLLSRAYGAALAEHTESKRALASAVHGPGSEQFWLTKAPSSTSAGGAPVRTLALGDRFTLPELLTTTASATDAAGTLEVVDVQEIAHASRSGIGAAASRMLLITAKAVSPAGIGLLANEDEARPLVRFVIDLDEVAPQGAKSDRLL